MSLQPRGREDREGQTLESRAGGDGPQGQGGEGKAWAGHRGQGGGRMEFQEGSGQGHFWLEDWMG